MENLNKENETKPCTIQSVVLSAVEKMTDAELIEEERMLNAEISANEDKLRSIENELFYRKNPECRTH